MCEGVAGELGGAREPEPLVLHVEDGVVLADEDVAQDPQRPVRRRDVQPHEPGQAHCLTELAHLSTHIYYYYYYT